MDVIAARLAARLALSGEGGKIDFGVARKQARDFDACFTMGRDCSLRFLAKEEVFLLQGPSMEETMVRTWWRPSYHRECEEQWNGGPAMESTDWRIG